MYSPEASVYSQEARCCNPGANLGTKVDISDSLRGSLSKQVPETFRWSVRRCERKGFRLAVRTRRFQSDGGLTDRHVSRELSVTCQKGRLVST